MVAWLVEPFASQIVQRALLGGLITAGLCAMVGTWVVLRGSAFLGDAMSHAVLPGVALASFLSGNLFVGAMIAALAMAYGVSAIGGSSRLSADTSIGLLLVGMLAVGVIIVSHSQSYAVDLTGFLFGDVLAVTRGDIAVLFGSLALTAVATYVGRRAFIAATFDSRKAATLALRPELAAVALTVLMAVAIVASFNVVGTLLVFGLLIAPPAAAIIWANTITGIMAAAALIGASSVVLGLLVSWHAGTAGGATIAAVAVVIFVCSIAAAAIRRRVARHAAWVAALLVVTACAETGTDAPPVDEQENPPANAQESDEPVTRLVLVAPSSGVTAVFDVLDENETRLGEFGPVDALSGDGRFGYLHTRGGLTIVDAGAWTFDHGDHNHYYVAPPDVVGTIGRPVASVAANQEVAAIRTVNGRVELLDRDRLGRREIAAPETPRVGELSGVAAAVPHGKGLLVATESGQVQAVDERGVVRSMPGDCPEPTGVVTTSRAAYFGCANGAIRVDVGGDPVAATPIPFPATRPAAGPGQLQHPDLNDPLARIAGDEVWVLDSARRTWSSVQVAGAVAANTGDDGGLLVLTRDGVLRAHDTTGAQTAALELFAGGIPSDKPTPVIEVDSDRAYVNNAAGRVVYEIDYGDALRLARTLHTEIEPGLMVEAGR
jgi:ABC-type Mn2+/Zn2+ transport system permease subunit